MSRNQLYKNRLELCLENDQNDFVRKFAKKSKKRLNEVMRIIIEYYMNNNGV